MILREVAYARSGDTGDTSNICVFVHEPADYPMLVERLTAERVREHFAGLVRGEVVRYELPRVQGLNFVLFQALDGGVSATLRIDPHGMPNRPVEGPADIASGGVLVFVLIG